MKFSISLFMSLTPRLALCTVFILFSAFRANAQGCYTPREAEAEQGIKIHSELMVIGLNCQHMTPTGTKNIYTRYQDITKKQSPLIASYEKTMISYFKRTGSHNPEKSLHDMRTELANSISKDAAQMRPDIFCARYMGRIPKVESMTSVEFQRWVKSSAMSGYSSHPICN